MLLKSWIFFFTVFFVFTTVSSMMDSTLLITGDAKFFDHVLGFQVDKIAQGGGFVGSIRLAFQFSTTTLPRWVTFNYSFLNQPGLEFVKAGLMVTLGGAMTALLAFTMVGVLRRQV